MQYITQISPINVKQPNGPLLLHAKQGDLGRWFQTTLLSGDQEWTAPSGAAVMIRYRKSDGTCGWYDTLENGDSATSLSGSVLSVGIAAQALTAPGRVWLDVSFYDTGEDFVERISTFNVIIDVEEEPLTDDEIESTDYYNVLSQQINGVLNATSHPPRIDDTTKNWLLWDEDENDYVDSGESSVGETGPFPMVTDEERTWQASSSGTTIPTGTWSSTIPSGTPGGYIWSKTVLTYDSGDTATLYGVSYQGQDGIGSPGSATPLVDEGSGAVGTAVAYSREDHKHPAPVVAFTVTLAAASWSNGVQTVSDSRFKASGYVYFVDPATTDRDAYNEAEIYADDVSTDGSMVFHCSAAPSAGISVKIARAVSA